MKSCLIYSPNSILYEREYSCYPCLILQVNSGARLLRVVRNDLADVVLVCEAKKKQTNYLRSLIMTWPKVYAVCVALLPYGYANDDKTSFPNRVIGVDIFETDAYNTY